MIALSESGALLGCLFMILTYSLFSSDYLKCRKCEGKKDVLKEVLKDALKEGKKYGLEEVLGDVLKDRHTPST